MTEIYGLNERIADLKLEHQEAERLNLSSKAGELLIDINYLEELRELRSKQEPCNDCVSRKYLLNAFGLSEKSRKYNGDHSGYDTRMLYEIQDVIEEAPTVYPKQEPVVHARWMSVPHKKDRICSRCEKDEPYKFADIEADVYDYCPHCGAIMDEGVEE